MFEYDRLVITTGLRSAEPPVKPIRGVFTLRSYEDAVAIRTYFARLVESLGSTRKPNVVLIGGSFISLEVASCFAGRANVTVMSRRGPFETIMGTQVSKKIQRLHESKGVKFFINSKFDIAGYDRSRAGNLEQLRLKDESKWPADLIVLAIGSKPVTEFLANSPVKLTSNNFVVVNRSMQTSVSNVYAAGDVVYFPRSCLPGLETTAPSGKSSAKISEELVNIAHWGVASSQGRVAAQAIIESDQAVPSSSPHLADRNALKVVPFFWSTQYGKALRFSGLNDNYEQVSRFYRIIIIIIIFN